jgi:PilZ domain-containing protein
MARERRRASERIPVKIPTTLGRAGGGTPVVIVVSDGGAAIRGDQPMPSAGLLTLHCLLPDTTDPFIATAEVVWQDTQGQSGIRFVNVAFTSRHILVEWLNDRATTRSPKELKP